jgi:hypothetical protein
MLIHHILDSLDVDVVEVRRKLLLYERIPTLLADLAAATSELHNLSHAMHILAEYYADIEAKIEFLSQAYNSYRDSGWAKTSEATMRWDLCHLEAMKWRTRVSKRWIMDYENRVNIRINHVGSSLPFAHWKPAYADAKVFHVSNQEQSMATAAIAQDAAKESSSMGTVAAVTLFFLPATFVCVSI